jgi:argininosuccinate lyase
MSEPVPETSNQLWDLIGHVLTTHAIAMGRESLIGPEVVSVLVGAIDRVRAQPADGDDLFDQVRLFDGRIDAHAPQDVAAAGRTGRSAVDVSATLARLQAMEMLRSIDVELARCEAGAIHLAEQNYPVLMPVTMDGFVSQPTSVAHWLSAVIGQLGRSREGMARAYGQIDQSPMGAGAMGSSGFTVDRARLAQDIGFNTLVESTFDAVASLDWVGDAANAIDAALTPMLRFGNEVFAWFRIEPDAFRIGDWLMESASGIPQWTGPYGLVKLTAELEHVAFQAHILAHEAASVTYGPQLAALGRLARGIQTVGSEALQLLRQCARFLEEGLVVNAAYFSNRAGRSFSTSSDLVDFLIIEEQLTPAAAEQIATLTISRARDQGLEAAGITSDLIDGAAMMVIGRELKVEFEAISRYLAPRRFIERRTVVGAPSPPTMRIYIQHRRQDLDERNQAALERTSRIADAMASVRQTAESIANDVHTAVQ